MPANETPPKGLEQQVLPYLTQIQAALRELIEVLPGVTRRPTDLQRTLDISVSLAWQVHRFAYAGEASGEVRNLPGRVAMQRFLQSARRRGATAERITEVQAVFDAFEEVAARHAENRTEFVSLLSGLAEDGVERVDLKRRRAAFEAQSHLLGFRADADVSCFVFAPSRANPMFQDAAAIRALTGVRRFRHDASIVIASMRTSHDDGASCGFQSKPLAPAADAGSTYLIPEYCSRPLPTLKESAMGDTVNVELCPDGIGAAAAVTCTIGHRLDGMFGRYRSQVDRHQNCHKPVRTPCKQVVLDAMVYRGLFGPNHPGLKVFTDHRDVDTSRIDRDCDLLPSREEVVFMGTGSEALKVEGVPQYEDIVAYALERMQQRLKDFDLFRVCIEYPLMPSSVLMQFDLRDAP